MSAAEVIAQIAALPEMERKIVERALFRLRHPEIPEDIVRGFEDCEDGNFVDMETVLNEAPPEHLR